MRGLSRLKATRPLERSHDLTAGGTNALFESAFALDEFGVTTPNVKNSTARRVAQTCRHWKSNRNRLLQLRNDGFRLGNAASHKRWFVQAEEERPSVVEAPKIPMCRLIETNRRQSLAVHS